MQERLKPFGEGVEVKWLSFFGSEGEIVLLRPSGLNSNEFKKFISLSKQLCEPCVLKENKLCEGLGKDGKAKVEAINYKNVDVVLEESNAPCIEKGIKNIL